MAHDNDDFDPHQTTPVAEALRRELCVVVLTGEHVATHPVPQEGRLVIGRSTSADVRIDDGSISRRHAQLTIESGQVSIEDLGSSNGTRVHGRTLAPGKPVVLNTGDIASLGSATLVLQPAEAWSRSRRATLIEPRRETSVPIETGEAAPLVVNAAMKELYTLVRRIAASSVSVLILGETGVGKEMVAESLHRHSKRSGSPLVRLNCATLTESLLESELFGHERGAFTGALKEKPGMLELASGGTVFLDEVGEMPLSTQAKLLRVLEERQVRRVGGTRNIAIDVRMIAATNRDLEAEASAGRFRLDLYYRLNGIALTVKPLRERLDEIGPFAELFIARACREMGRDDLPRLSAEGLALLQRYRWPGNVRELRNMIDRAVLLCAEDELLPEHFPEDKLSGSSEARPKAYEHDDPTAVHEEDDWATGRLDTNAERERILKALAAAAGNQTLAAKKLAMSRSSFVRRLNALGITRPRKGQ